MPEPISCIQANWPLAGSVSAITSTRKGGLSHSPYDSLNIAFHVDDETELVQQNRQRLITHLSLPTPPLWLNQTHSTIVIDAKDWQDGIEADAIYTNQVDQVCAVMTADCLPVLLCNRSCTEVAAIHAGWRGLADGIIEKTVRCFTDPPEEIFAWLGPAIGPEKFEVGLDVFDHFYAHDHQASSAFTSTDDKHFLADIYALAKQRLITVGIQQISGGQYCTVSDRERFFSFRRDGETGRMVSLIWIPSK
ncbi:MAG TPA: peptidoglycan editing factor PgeF [Methylophaga aminisulfidivorans]|uniref:Purine nucleoside phosphorylase n=1 Tax=Methylophaga aminisulfidivorans TaxID=230105 RepID=A0A7C1VRF0_9GAMM|nr:peptidoglycan editing factor PgeF [Methylophaga aminisulfidivorans]HEC73621.1 peptidoglycan editing factor PgeF [Methylophaga aminisulfidivorans]